ncbi:protein of unknown function (plasmid) [Thiomonas sp. Sup16B3]|nr:protein of unknown function [Thiomonas sp. Sup16B3]
MRNAGAGCLAQLLKRLLICPTGMCRVSFMPAKARVDSVRASLRVLLFFLLRGVKKTAWRRHGAMVSYETLSWRLGSGARNRACRSKTHSADAGLRKGAR